MPKIYCISGLGANELAFSKLGELKYEKVLVPWLKHDPQDTIKTYSKKIILEHGITSKDLVLGLSFGGLIAQHISKELNLTQAILVSTFRDLADLKPFFKFGLTSNLYKIFPARKAPLIDGLVANFLNSGTPESKPILKQMMGTTDYKFMNWAINQIAITEQIQLENTKVLNLLVSKDRIVSQWSIEKTEVIQGGSHFMIFDKAKEISEVINKHLAAY